MRGWLRNGNAPGDPTTAPRCGARTRCGTACRCPALRGRQRCRLHGGRSTGPRTAEGLARIRGANTRHGRCCREQLAFEREVRRFTAEGFRSAAAMGRSRSERARFMRAAAQPLSRAILERIREMVRAELAREEQARLSAARGSHVTLSRRPRADPEPCGPERRRDFQVATLGARVRLRATADSGVERITEEQLRARIVEVDLRDGQADGRMTPLPKQCPKCQAKMSPQFGRCLFCGFQRRRESVLSGSHAAT